MQVPWASLRLLVRLASERLDSDAAAEAIIAAAARTPPRSLTVLTLGPATNLARALVLAPWLAGHLRGVVLMGGGADPGLLKALKYQTGKEPQVS